MVLPALCQARALRVVRASTLAGLAFAVLFVATPANAETEQEPIRLEYQADAGCPTPGEFERMVFKRTHSARPAKTEEPARVFSVALQQSGSTVNGSLTVTEGEQTLVRRVSGHACRELASVLALATALAIDPSAEILPEAAQDEQPISEPPGQEAPADVGTRTSVGTQPYPFDPPDALPTEPSVRAFRVGLGPKLEWAATPNVALGPSLSFEMFSTPPSWTLGASINGLLSPTREVSDARADFGLLTAGLYACALGLHWQDTLQAGPCVAWDLGQIYASSENLAENESVRRFWSTIGVHLHLVTLLSEHWSLNVSFGPNFVLTQYDFVIDEPETRVFEQGNWTGSARMSLTYRL